MADATWNGKVTRLFGHLIIVFIFFKWEKLIS